MVSDLGRLEQVALREHWPTEDRHFTPWLSEPENLQLLSDTLGIPLTLEAMEHWVGPYRADLICLEGGTGGEERRVVIENQFGRSDHDHLGKLLTYMAGTDAFTGIWITEELTDEHRAALEWLNDHSEPTKAVWGLEVQLWRIGTSRPAPRFNVVVAPNPVTKLQHETSSALSERQRDRLQFWEGFHEALAGGDKSIRVSKPRPETWVNHSIGRSGVVFGLVYTNYDLEAQTFVEGSVTRVELVLTGPNAFQLYEQLLRERTEIEAELGVPLPVWYDIANKERKIFVQQLWPDGAPSQQLQYEWLQDHLLRMKAVFEPRVRVAPTSRA